MVHARRDVPACCSTWVTINAETRKLAKIPADVKQKFLRLAPSPPRSAIPTRETRRKLPEFAWPAQVCMPARWRHHQQHRCPAASLTHYHTPPALLCLPCSTTLLLMLTCVILPVPAPLQLTAPTQLCRRSDMDPNGHVNNTAYLAWALDVIPDDIYRDYQLTEVCWNHRVLPVV